MSSNNKLLWRSGSKAGKEMIIGATLRTNKFMQVGLINDAQKAFDLLDQGVAAKISKTGVGPHQNELITEGSVVDF